jgi:hypothetical protein
MHYINEVTPVDKQKFGNIVNYGTHRHFLLGPRELEHFKFTHSVDN